MLTKELAYCKISELVERFGEQFDSYKKADYNETMTRRDFIDPFFKALGWDIDNENGYAESYREVIHEDKVKVGKATKAPDYSFRLVGGKRLFFVEAKKPGVVVKDDIQPAYQIRRYGWSAKLSISIITDFEEFAIYDCTKKPAPTDRASVARIKYLTYLDYLKDFDFLWDTFSKERVLKGSFDKFVSGSANKKGTATVDKEFLQSLDSWRTYLATSISWYNRQLDEDEINFVVQQTIDRIIFLRIAEDRGVELYGNLKLAIKHGEFYKNLFQQFELADQKYNSGLFDFKKDTISKGISVDNKVIKNIISELYYPESPYEFSVLSVEILGNVYEQFLGKQIKVDKAHRARIEEKPEVRKAGGVYYTPQYIVDYIVKNTAGKLIENKSPKDVNKIKIVDPACGSGSFLIGAYQYLLDWHKNYYSENGKISKGNKTNPLTPDGHLTTAEKKRILLNNIFGVDIDVNAVEVTKLSLLLKCMEGETEASITAQLRLFSDRVLPTLDNNIKSGNSLVSTDIYENELFEWEVKIKPFNWHQAFPEVFKTREPAPDLELKYHNQKIIDQAINGEKRAKELIRKMGGLLEDPQKQYGMGGFDCVIGNPPYVRQELIGELKKYFESHYRVYQSSADLYTYFIEKGMNLLNNNGLMGIIVANKWMRSNYGEPLRKWIKNYEIKEIIDFGDLPVFQGTTTYPCICIFGKEKSEEKFTAVKVKTLQFESLTKYASGHNIQLDQNSLDDCGWNLAEDEEKKLIQKIKDAGVPLNKYVNSKIFYGIKTGYNKAFIIDEEIKDNLIREDSRSIEVIKPFLTGKDIKRYHTKTSQKYLILFPKGFTNEKGDYPKNGWNWLQENYPAVAGYLITYKESCTTRYDKGDYWWELRACEYYKEFEKPKIILPDIALKMQACFDFNKLYCINTAYIIPVDDKYLLAILNSDIVQYYYSKISSSIRGGYLRFIRQYLETIPIPIPIPIPINDKYSKEIEILVAQLLQLNSEKDETKLQTKINQIEGMINYCEEKINEIVYQLYGLTEDEIKIVEGKC